MARRPANDTQLWGSWSHNPKTGKWEVRGRLDGGEVRRTFDTEGALHLFRMEQSKFPIPGRSWESHATRHTLESFLPLFYASHPVKPNTMVGYRRRLRVTVLPALGLNRYLDDISAADLQAILVDMANNDYAAGTIKTTIFVLKSLFRTAVEQGFIEDSPAAKLKVPGHLTKEEEVRNNYWSEDQLDLFLRVIQGHRHQNLFTVLALTGMRIGEVVGLQWGDVDLEANTITINRTFSLKSKKDNPNQSERTFSSPKSYTSRRTIPIRPRVVEALKAQRKAQLERQLRLGPRWVGPKGRDGWVFDANWKTSHGMPLHIVSLRQPFKFFIADMQRLDPNVQRVTIHGLRHTFATLLLKGGVPIKVVSELLGHADITTTLKVYGHVTPGMRETGMATLESILDRIGLEESLRTQRA